MPSGFKEQQDQGVAIYKTYVHRATFPMIVSPTIEGMLGLIHRNESQIDMPDAMKPLTANIDGKGMTLEAFHKQITREL